MFFLGVFLIWRILCKSVLLLCVRRLVFLELWFVGCWRWLLLVFVFWIVCGFWFWNGNGLVWVVCCIGVLLSNVVLVLLVSWLLIVRWLGFILVFLVMFFVRMWCWLVMGVFFIWFLVSWVVLVSWFELVVCWVMFVVLFVELWLKIWIVLCFMVRFGLFMVWLFWLSVEVVCWLKCFCGVLMLCCMWIVWIFVLSCFIRRLFWRLNERYWMSWRILVCMLCVFDWFIFNFSVYWVWGFFFGDVVDCIRCFSNILRMVLCDIFSFDVRVL